jgi:aromatic-amino-acid transaminase
LFKIFLINDIILEFNQRNFSGILAVSDPTWANHVTIANYLGLELLHYPYYDKKGHTVRFQECLDFFEKLPPKAMVLLQAECHNPSGMNFSLDEWAILADLFKRRHLIPFFDIAYQGYALDLESDVAPVRLFVRKGLECFIAYSYSKNFGIYSERVGAVMVVASDRRYKGAISSQVKAMIRANYSNPPCHGGSIISMILDTPDLRSKWEKELYLMAKGIRSKRKALSQCFMRQSGGNEYAFIEEATGFFSLLNLTVDQTTRLREEYGVYVTSQGRINIAGVNDLNIEKIVDSVIRVSYGHIFKKSESVY